MRLIKRVKINDISYSDEKYKTIGLKLKISSKRPKNTTRIK